MCVDDVHMITEALIKETLTKVKYPGFSRDIVAFGLVQDIEIDGTDVHVQISVATKDPKVPEQIFKDSQDALNSISGIGTTRVSVDVKDVQAENKTAADAKESIPGIKKIIAVASGKGGVGKSTVASNLAVTLAKQGHKVGLCDCDLYGPSTAMMFGTDEQPMADEDDNIVPIKRHGVKIMSMGLLLDDTSPVIVRGPMATRYTQQFLRQVAWGKLDYLILDLPPGTGDIQLTIVQTVALDGAVIVTTPQEVALTDARKAITMFSKVNVDILGLIENMAWFECDAGKKYYIFGEGGGVAEAKRINTPLLGQIPIDSNTRIGGDQGTPVALMSTEKSTVSAAFAEVATKLEERTNR